ncbi:hypothetical protein SAMN05421827_11910 [Pedobacter terrae]|uniref:Uncharacterized protein n=1 Tax=Pedobacter terrae TaxID=405671 RepID=A0A1G8AHX6_9SPHI|nr:hypothetical protein [Pedobacter terrae]SDH20453.1 hypothetical protein SAMN05421827_11910 [Pedobacter terrae]
MMKKKSKKLNLIFIILVNTIALPSFAQQKTNKQNQDASIQKKIYSVFFKSSPKSFLKDSSAIYVFNFKLHIVKKTNGKAIAVKIVASDSLAYKLFPTYKKLYELDYSHLSNEDNSATLVIPIMIFTVGRDKKNEYLISTQAAINTLQDLNRNDDYDQDMAGKQQTNPPVAFTKIILAAPVVFDYSIKPLPTGTGIIK